MTLPALVRTWQFQVNQLVAPQPVTTPTLLATSRLLMRTIKNSLIGNGVWTDSAGAVTASTNSWAVRSSCDGSGGAGSFGNSDGVDRWAADANLVWAAAASNHSWIVLRQTGIAVNFEICIDLSNGASSTATIVVSFAAGFGSAAIGTATARPTATDEQVVMNNTTWGSEANFTQKNSLHVMKSADGASTRVIITRPGDTGQTQPGIFTTALWMFEKPSAYWAAWTNPSASVALGGSGNNTAIGTTATLATTPNTHSRTAGGTNFTSVWTSEVTSSLAFIRTYYGSLTGDPVVENDISAEFPGFPISLYSATVNARGVNGELVDVWFGIEQLSSNGGRQATAYPASGTLNQFVQFGEIIYPWNRSVPLLFG